jgi:crossover junction endodeoxyribonuclease RusA
VEVWVEFGAKDPKKRRDPHNWYPTIKAILDGFTNAAVWADDDSEHVKTYEPVFSDKVPVGSLRITLTWEVE